MCVLTGIRTQAIYPYALKDKYSLNLLWEVPLGWRTSRFGQFSIAPFKKSFSCSSVSLWAGSLLWMATMVVIEVADAGDVVDAVNAVDVGGDWTKSCDRNIRKNWERKSLWRRNGAIFVLKSKPMKKTSGWERERDKERESACAWMKEREREVERWDSVRERQKTITSQDFTLPWICRGPWYSWPRKTPAAAIPLAGKTTPWTSHHWWYFVLTA